MPPGEIFDPSEKGIAAADVAALLKSGEITPAAELQESSNKVTSKRPNVADTLALIASAQTLEELDKLAEYCKVDVDVTRRIYNYGCENGFVQYLTRLGSKQKVKVNWKC